MNTTVDVSIVIVNWNSKAYLSECIASVIAHTRRVSYEIIVVDSASFDGCDAMLRQSYPQVTFIQAQENLGFGLSNNLGVEHARSDTILLLNPDTVLRDDAISRMHEEMARLHKAGIVGCRLLNTDGTLQNTCVQPFPTILNQVLESKFLEHHFKNHAIWRTAESFEQDRAIRTVEVIAGACMLMRRDVFQALGGFSKDYFMYAEDVDLCFKVRQAGMHNYYVPDVEIIHHGGGSTRVEHKRFSVVVMRESLRRYMARTRGAMYGGAYRVAMTVSAVVRLTLIAFSAPLAIFKGRFPAWRGSLGKWVSVLRWGLGLERWVHKHYRYPVSSLK